MNMTLVTQGYMPFCLAHTGKDPVEAKSMQSILSVSSQGSMMACHKCRNEKIFEQTPKVSEGLLGLINFQKQNINVLTFGTQISNVLVL